VTIFTNSQRPEISVKHTKKEANERKEGGTSLVLPHPQKVFAISPPTCRSLYLDHYGYATAKYYHRTKMTSAE
jgi:hypothetical protein